ncbi:MAG: hypothetical protein ACP6IY_21825 [Promethearchaeia archaeon]
MALTYTYIHYIDPLFFFAFGLPRLISAFFSFIMNFFIYKAGTQRVEDNESSRLLKNIGIINIVISVIPLALPLMDGTPVNEVEFVSMILFYILQGLVTSVPFFITYGILMYLFAKRNKEKYNWYIFGTAFSLAIAYLADIANLNGFLMNIINFTIGVSSTFLILTTILGIISSYGSIIGFLLLLAHGLKFKENNLRNAGIVYIIAVIAIYLINVLLISPALRAIL